LQASGSGSTASLVSGNRLYNNSFVAISADSGAQIVGNFVYSNSIGVRASTSFAGLIASNLIYNNTNRGILVQNGSNSFGLAEYYNNTIYQPVGDSIRLDTGARNNRIFNNIAWVLAGYGIYVANDSQTGLASDYNLFHQGTDPNAYVGFWNGVNRDTLSDWRTASTRDPSSLEGNPGFVDIDGGDNILGYVSAAGGIDGGADDNFYRTKNSLAIDRGSSWFSATSDIESFGRFDDPATNNAGAQDYAVIEASSSLFAAVGTAKTWRSDDNSWSQAIGFNFPLYGINYTTVNVGSNGLLQFNSTSPWPGDPANSTASLNSAIRIAPLWDDLRTDQTGDDIFVDTSIANQITIRWAATVKATGAKANFSATLFSDGRIRFDYGNGNAGLTPTVGISRGDGRFFRLVSGYNGATSLTNANSVAFNLVPGIVDIGAYEFRGDSSDNVSPTVVGTSPLAPVTVTRPTDVRLTFSEELNPIDARSPAAYELRGAGPDSTFDTADDIVYKLKPQYVPGQNTVTLGLEGTVSPLPVGVYRVTAFGTVSTSLYDLAGNRFDGNADGIPGGNYVRTFKVIMNSAPILVGLNSFDDIDENQFNSPGTLVSALLNNRVTDADGPGRGIAVQSAVSSTGAWQYSLDGVNFIPIAPKLAGGKLLLLSADSDTRVRYVPTADYSGTVNDLALLAWDQADGLIEGTSENIINFLANSLSSANFNASIRVVHRNFAPTDIQLSSTAFNENAPVGTAVGTLTAVDANPGDTFTFTLLPGTGSDDNALFIVEGNVLKTKNLFDFEARSSYSVRVKAADQYGAAIERIITLTVKDLTEVLSVVVGDGTNQRSHVKQVVVTFDGLVDIDNLNSGTFAVRKRNSNFALIATNAVVSVGGSGPSATTVVTLTFSGINILSNGSLTDGNYDLIINANNISRSGSTALEAKLDGDRDGTTGGDFRFGSNAQNTVVAADGFFRLFGDARGSGSVDNSNLQLFNTAYRKRVGQTGYNAAFDVKEDGVIDNADLSTFNAQYRKRINFT